MARANTIQLPQYTSVHLVWVPVRKLFKNYEPTHYVSQAVILSWTRLTNTAIKTQTAVWCQFSPSIIWQNSNGFIFSGPNFKKLWAHPQCVTKVLYSKLNQISWWLIKLIAVCGLYVGFMCWGHMTQASTNRIRLDSW